jgi:alginate O-acetyltransferase complex protein AlgI
MLFNSFSFAVFFATILVLHRLPVPWTFKKGQLLVASYLFYMAWNPPFVVLLWISTLVDWHVGKRLYVSHIPHQRKWWLRVSLAVNLGLLGYFKYAGFVLENFVALLASIGIDYAPAPPDIVLPLGISFYTFQTLSYTFSIYRREAKPAPRLLDFALFVTFFPQLVAGPIVRSTDFLKQLVEPVRANARQFGWGLALLNFGLFQKVVLSDTLLAPVSDIVFGAAGRAGAVDAWVGTLAFAGQILFDFGGYSSCAIGAALCLGFILPENFRCPYAAVGFSDFWRRWHISLSSWLRDYLYISLGGNRRGSRRTHLNLAVTMLLGGLWHGASWNFVVWGGLHGFYLIVERSLRGVTQGVRALATVPFQLLGGALTFALVTLTWVFFRAETLSDSQHLVGVMLGGGVSALLDAEQIGVVGGVMAVLLFAQALFRERDLEAWFESLPTVVKGPVLALPLIALFAVPGDQRAFIYFQF